LERATASGSPWPRTEAPGTAVRTVSAAAAARSATREPITTGAPAAAKRSARPSPWRPVPPMNAMGSSDILRSRPASIQAGVRRWNELGRARRSRCGEPSSARLRRELEAWAGDLAGGGRKIPLDSVRHRDYVALLRPRTPGWPYPVGRYDSDTGQAHSPAPAQPLA